MQVLPDYLFTEVPGATTAFPDDVRGPLLLQGALDTNFGSVSDDLWSVH